MLSHEKKLAESSKMSAHLQVFRTVRFLRVPRFLIVGFQFGFWTGYGIIPSKALCINRFPGGQEIFLAEGIFYAPQDLMTLT
jgi:hypothetical protein